MEELSRQRKKQPPITRTIAFVKVGEKPKTTSKSSAGMLDSAKDWHMLVDLEKQLRFPGHIVATKLRPDIVLTSDSTRQVVMLELTVPCEERLDEAYERKLAKYSDLVEGCQQAGWKAKCFPVEVGCRGFAARSPTSAFSKLGLLGAAKSKAVRNATDAAERASRWLWMKGGES